MTVALTLPIIDSVLNSQIFFSRFYCFNVRILYFIYKMCCFKKVRKCWGSRNSTGPGAQSMELAWGRTCIWGAPALWPGMTSEQKCTSDFEDLVQK